jgi:methylenetetrahydrofolate reductase (NADPH)
MEQATDPAAEGVRICADIIRELSDVKGVAGVHIMAPGNDAAVPGLIKAARAGIGRLAPA